MVGLSREEALDVVAPGPWWPEDVIPAIMSARRDVLKAGFAESDWTLLGPGREPVECHVTSAVMHDADGVYSGIVVTVRDKNR
jgi:hypothetical protein